MTAHLNRSIHVLGRLEHVASIKAVSIEACSSYKVCFYWSKQSTSIKYLPTYYTRITILGSSLYFGHICTINNKHFYIEREVILIIQESSRQKIKC